MESWIRNYRQWWELLNPPDHWRKDPRFTRVVTRRFFDFLSMGWSIAFIANTNPLWRFLYPFREALWRYGIQVDELMPGYQWLDDDDGGDVYG